MKCRLMLLALMPVLACASDPSAEAIGDQGEPAVGTSPIFFPFGFDTAWEDTHFAPFGQSRSPAHTEWQRPCEQTSPSKQSVFSLHACASPTWCVSFELHAE